MYPRSYFQQHDVNPEPGRCFVMMPFDTVFDPVYAAVSGVVESSAIGFNCRRADDVFGGGHVMSTVLEEIAHAEVAIVDASTRNPNVFYELGIVHMVKDAEKVLIITQSAKDIPFDIQQFRWIPYDSSAAGLEELKGDLVKAFGETAEDSFRVFGKNLHALQCERPILGLDRCRYTFSMPDLEIGPDFAKFKLVLERKVVGRPAKVVHRGSYGLDLGGSCDLPGTGWILMLEETDGRDVTFRVARAAR